MSLASSIEALFSRLDDFRRFPKYSLERRLDLFIALFIEEFLSTRYETPIRIVAPEFPLKKKGDSNLSTNVDYLLYREGPKPAWILLELKTAEKSFHEEQEAIYRWASGRGMQALIEDLRKIKRASDYKERYNVLIKQVNSINAPADAAIEIAYLAPARSSDSPAIFWFLLDDFAKWSPTQHVELWPYVKKLLDGLSKVSNDS
jgi:hypothetical protein